MTSPATFATRRPLRSSRAPLGTRRRPVSLRFEGSLARRSCQTSGHTAHRFRASARLSRCRYSGWRRFVVSATPTRSPGCWRSRAATRRARSCGRARMSTWPVNCFASSASSMRRWRRFSCTRPPWCCMPLPTRRDSRRLPPKRTASTALPTSCGGRCACATRGRRSRSSPIPPISAACGSTVTRRLRPRVGSLYTSRQFSDIASTRAKCCSASTLVVSRCSAARLSDLQRADEIVETGRRWLRHWTASQRTVAAENVALFVRDRHPSRLLESLGWIGFGSVRDRMLVCRELPL